MSRSGSRGDRSGEAARALARALAAAILLAACETGALAAELPKKTPSGEPVPRYVSLRYSEVNARVGPSERYDTRWAYKTRGLPLQVIAETAEWIRVCDPEGQVAWIALRMADSHRRTVMRTLADPLPLRRRPADT